MFDWKKILLSPKASLEKSIKVLHEGGYRIALVVDEQNKLLGTVTDGDVRRALITKFTMDSEIKLIMNAQPIKISKPFSRKELLSIMSSKGSGVNAFPIHEYWLDIGHIDEYEKASRDAGTIFNL